MEVLLTTKFSRHRVKYALVMAIISSIIALSFSFIAYNIETTPLLEEIVTIFGDIIPDSIINTDAPSTPPPPLPNRGLSQEQPQNGNVVEDTNLNLNNTTENFLTGVLVFADVRVSTASSITIGMVCSALTFIITLLSSLIFYRMLFTEREDINEIEHYAIKHHRDPVARLVVGISMGVILMVISWFCWTLVGMMFSNLWLTKTSAIFVTIGYCAIIGFFTTYILIGLRTMDVVGLGLLTFVLGLFGSFLLSNDPEWWQISLSYLGYNSGSNSIFRLSMIIVGIMLLFVMRDLGDTLFLEVQMGLLGKTRFRIMTGGAILGCFGIIGVGAFPVRTSELLTFLHNASVYTAALAFIIGMLGIGYIAPKIYHPFFIKLSWGLFGVIMFFTLLYVLGVYNFVALETLSFAIFGVWLFFLHEFTLHHLTLQGIDNVKRSTQVFPALTNSMWDK